MNVSFQPDPLPLREGLRRLRHIAKRSGDTARGIANGAIKADETSIASRIASTLIVEIEKIAEELDKIAVRAARQAFGHDEDLTVTLEDLYRSAPSVPFLASTLYTAITLVLKHIGSDMLFVSELSVREAMRRWQAIPDHQKASDIQLAAWLAHFLMECNVIRGSYIDARCVVPANTVKPVVIYAVMLWLLVARSPEDSESALISASDIATTFAEKIGLVFSENNEKELIKLLEKYRNNV